MCSLLTYPAFQPLPEASRTSRVKCFATDDTSSVLSGFGRKPPDRGREGHIITSLDAASVYDINLACVFRRYLQTVDRHDQPNVVSLMT